MQDRKIEIEISAKFDNDPGARVSITTAMNPLESIETLLLTASVILRDLKGVADNAVRN